MASDGKYLGVCPSRSLETFSESDVSDTISLVEYLDTVAPLETVQGDQIRQIVIGLLKRITCEWCYETAISLGASESLARETKCALVAFGSYKLGGLIGPSSDMDLVCICPSILTVDAFFTRLVAKLHEVESVSEIVPIPTAFTPIIKLKVNGIDIDLLFSRLAVPRIDMVGDISKIDSDDKFLCGIDQRSARALNGPRVANMILKLVPNLETFRTTLRAVKFWANRRQIYANVLGYFGGIAWAICVAKTCQLYPNYSPSQLLETFFILITEPDTFPVKLNQVEMKDQVEFAHFQVWSPDNPRGGLMPVLTPAFPCQNATDPVTESTKKVIIDECSRAVAILNPTDMALGVDTDESPAVAPTYEEKLKNLFSEAVPTNPMIRIEISGATQKVFSRIKGFVELKLRSLIYSIEKIDQNNCIALRPFSDIVDETASSGTMVIGYTCSSSLVPDLRPASSSSLVPDLRPAIDRWMRQLAEWNERDEWTGTKYDVKVTAICSDEPSTKRIKV